MKGLKVMLKAIIAKRCLMTVGILAWIATGAAGATFEEAWGGWSPAAAPELDMTESVGSWEELLRGAWLARDAWIRKGKRTEIPPGTSPMVLDLGAVAVAPGMLPADAETEREYGVPVWRLRVRETENGGAQAFVATVGKTPLSVATEPPSYDGTAWTEWVYGAVPAWLGMEEKASWLMSRARNRIGWSATLVPSGAWETYKSNRAADASGMEGLELSEIRPVADGETIRLGVRSGAAGAWVRLLETEDLSDGEWTYRGLSLQGGGRGVTEMPGNGGRAGFWTATEGTDTDGDGIPDAVETLSLGTNPRMQDTSGDGLGDWEKAYRYELDPAKADNSGDGISDAERVAAGNDPREAATPAELSAASKSIRYAYDDDGRLVGTWFGTGAAGGGITTRLTPAGNPLEVHQLCPDK